jgi:hypothetical protein
VIVGTPLQTFSPAEAESREMLSAPLMAIEVFTGFDFLFLGERQPVIAFANIRSIGILVELIFDGLALGLMLIQDARIFLFAFAEDIIRISPGVIVIRITALMDMIYILHNAYFLSF